MKDWVNQEVKENALASSGGEMEGLTSSIVLEASVISTKIGSFWGSADEGSVGAKSNAWDNSSAPRADWDAMFDNYEERGLEVEYHFEEKMNCLPGQLMVSFCEVFSQWQFFGLSLGPSYVLMIDTLQL